MSKSIGIDIGGTKTSIGLVEGESILKKVEISTLPNVEGEKILSKIIDHITPLLDKDVTGIGIGAAGQIGLKGEVVSATNTFPNWTGLNIKNIISDATSKRVEVVNDVQAMGLGEQNFGEGKNLEHFLCIAIGTGVGGAIISNGKLNRGYHGAAGEIGHMIIHGDGRLCPCGNKGCLEAHVSGTALESLYLDRYETIKKGKDIFYEASQGSRKALSILDLYVSDLVNGITSLVHIFNPEKVILGGGVSYSLSPYLKAIRKQVGSKVSRVNQTVSIELSQLRGDAMLLGAASLVM